MSQDYFPAIQPEMQDIVQEPLPLLKECAWDFDKGVPIIQNGNPVIVSGKEALKVWIWKTLKTPLGRYRIYNHDHGHQLEELIGQNFIEATKKAEATRYITEALEVSPYITDITELKIDFTETTVSVSGRIESIYGEVIVDV